jgi:hypothetical protein
VGDDLPDFGAADKIVARFQQLVSQKGEAAVLY